MEYKNRKAIIDCGTNTFHLLIADINGNNKLKVLHKEKFPVKIGEGGIEDNIILEAPIKRAVDTIRRFKNEIDKYNVNKIIATGTSAFRNAKNGKQVATIIETETGIKINIIDGEKEAKLIYKGVSKAIKLTDEYYLIMDIGGGSVEFIISNKNEIKWLKSFEIGGQRLLERFHINDPISLKEINSLNKFLDHELEELYKICDKYRPNKLVGASGSFDTLSAIFCTIKGEYFNEDESQSFHLPIENTLSIIDNIISKNHLQRLSINGMSKLRVDMIVVACLLVKRIMNKIHFNEIITTSYALKEGLLFSEEF